MGIGYLFSQVDFKRLRYQVYRTRQAAVVGDEHVQTGSVCTHDEYDRSAPGRPCHLLELFFGLLIAGVTQRECEVSAYRWSSSNVRLVTDGDLHGDLR